MVVGGLVATLHAAEIGGGGEGGWPASGFRCSAKLEFDQVVYKLFEDCRAVGFEAVFLYQPSLDVSRQALPLQLFPGLVMPLLLKTSSFIVHAPVVSLCSSPTSSVVCLLDNTSWPFVRSDLRLTGSGCVHTILRDRELRVGRRR